jgi:16S rRNA (cytosine967-C5)-methyltransferase
MHLNNVYPLVTDGRRPGLCSMFTKVLVDAPCTGTGVLNRHPEARWLRTKGDIGTMAQVQIDLLSSAANLVEPNGAIVYSTCSLEPEENDQVVERFLHDHPGFALQRPPSSIPALYTDLAGYLRIVPQEHGMDGRFGALLKRLPVQP